jgi:rod shape-determining protein MreC
MFEFLSRYRTGITCLVLSTVLLTVIAGQVPAQQHPSVLAWALYAVISPFQQVTAYMVTGATDLWEEYLQLHDVRLENRELKRELARLHQKNQKLEETLALVGGELELRSFELLYEETYGNEPINAVVIGAGSGSNNNLQSLIVNKGSLDGVAINSAVISPYGVVGKIIQVGPTSSLVQLITDPMFSMAVRLHESRVSGMVSGLGSDGSCILQYVRDTDPINVGDKIVSSGLDQIFPRGILVGRVSAVSSEGLPSFKRVEVLPAVNLRSLEWVLIVEWPESTKINE